MKRILVVEDDEGLSKTIARYLEAQMQWLVFQVQTVNQAFMEFGLQRIDGVITDVDLKAGGNGIALLSAMKDMGFRIPVYVQSGNPEWENQDLETLVRKTYNPALFRMKGISLKEGVQFLEEHMSQV